MPVSIFTIINTIPYLVQTKSNMADSWGKAREEVTCSICSGLFVEPKIFPCLHTFCKKCLQGAWKESVSSTEHVHGEIHAWQELDKRYNTDHSQDAHKQS